MSSARMMTTFGLRGWGGADERFAPTGAVQYRQSNSGRIILVIFDISVPRLWIDCCDESGGSILHAGSRSNGSAFSSNAEPEEQSQGFSYLLWVPVKDERARELH